MEELGKERNILLANKEKKDAQLILIFETNKKMNEEIALLKMKCQQLQEKVTTNKK